MLDLIIKNGICYIDGKLKKADIGIKNSKISEIGSLEKKKIKRSIGCKEFDRFARLHRYSSSF